MRLILLLLLTAATLKSDDRYRLIIEKKYATPVQRFETISITSSTKVLLYEWETNWWGSFNVIETAPDGAAIFWYDILYPPSGNTIVGIRPVKANGKIYVEAIDKTHMGNGYVYLFEVRAGVLRTVMKARVMANLGELTLDLAGTNIEYCDLDKDGDDDIVCGGKWEDESDGKSGEYHREFLYTDGSFSEDRRKRVGRTELFE